MQHRKHVLMASAQSGYLDYTSCGGRRILAARNEGTMHEESQRGGVLPTKNKKVSSVDTTRRPPTCLPARTQQETPPRSIERPRRPPC